MESLDRADEIAQIDNFDWSIYYSLKFTYWILLLLKFYYKYGTYAYILCSVVQSLLTYHCSSISEMTLICIKYIIWKLLPSCWFTVNLPTVVVELMIIGGIFLIELVSLYFGWYLVTFYWDFEVIDSFRGKLRFTEEFTLLHLHLWDFTFYYQERPSSSLSPMSRGPWHSGTADGMRVLQQLQWTSESHK